MKKGIRFGDIHSFDELNLVLAPFTPSPAIPKTNYIEIAGADGSLDLTEAHGEVKYKDREFKFSFTVNPSDAKTFDEKVTEVSNALNGKKCKITFDRDSDYYWIGRCIVDEYAQDRNLKQISVKATVKPYKLKQSETIATYTLSSTEKTVTLTNGRKSVVPEITCTNNNTVLVFGDITKTIGAGTHKFLDIQFKQGANVLKMSGSGTITFKYQEAEL